MGKQNKIYVFEKPDGTYGAEYSLERASRLGIIREKHILNDPQKVIDNPGLLSPGRVKALAERALQERPNEVEEVPHVSIRKLSFWGRLKWLLQGK